MISRVQLLALGLVRDLAGLVQDLVDLRVRVAREVQAGARLRLEELERVAVGIGPAAPLVAGHLEVAGCSGPPPAVAESTSWTSIVMPASASCALIASASWTLIGMLLVVTREREAVRLAALGQLLLRLRQVALDRLDRVVVGPRRRRNRPVRRHADAEPDALDDRLDVDARRPPPAAAPCCRTAARVVFNW